MITDPFGHFLGIAAAIFIFAVSIRSYLRGPDNRVHRAYAAMSAALGAWILVDAAARLLIYFEIYVTDVLFSAGEVPLLAAGWTLAHFGRIFPRRIHYASDPHAEERREPITLRSALGAIAVVLAAFSFTDFYVSNRVLRPTEGTYEGTFGIVYYMNRLYLLACVIISLREQLRFQALEQRDPRRIHSQYLIYSLWITLALGTALLAAVFFLPGDPVIYPLRTLVSVLFVLFVQGILMHRSINLRGSIYRNVVLFGSSVLVLIPVFFLTNYLLAFMYARSPYLLAGVLCALVLLFHQGFKRLQPYILKVVFRRETKAEESVAEFSSSILHLSSGEKTDVRRRLIEFLGGLYAPRFVAFYAYDPEAIDKGLVQDRTLTRIADVESIPPAAFPDPLLFLLSNRERGTPDGGLMVDLMAAAERAQDHRAAAELTRLAACGAELLIPFHESREVEGAVAAQKTEEIEAVLVFGMSKNGHPLDHTDVALLRALRAPALLAMKNQELFSATRRLQDRLEEENRKITKRLTQDLPGVAQANPTSAFVFKPGATMATLMEQAERFASRAAPVLISGETGTGKEQIAKMLHAQSGRSGNLVTVNCSAIPHDLIENELFGHEKGAYTGAVDSAEGLVARAENGTLFLDEIGEMPMPGQVKLLRLIQEGEYERVGSSEQRKTNARFVFATNRNLEDEVAQGRFRSDLYYRINTFEIHVPALRERKEDIPFLVDHFLWVAGQTFHRPGLTLSEGARSMLLRHNWPGNVRELENLLLRAVVLSDSEVLDEESLPVMFRDELDFTRKKAHLDRMADEQARLEKELLLEALERTGGNQRQAAQILNISRGSLQYKMKQYGLVQN